MFKTKSILGLILCLNLFMLFSLGCEPETKIQMASREKLVSVENLITSQPSIPLKWSMDRYLLNERNHRFNDPNKMNYLYMVLIDGTWLKTTIIGKMTSTSKRLTPPEFYGALGSAAGGTSYGTQPSPDDMGTWGTSEPAKICMTTLGSLLESGGFMSYLYSETPLTFSNMNKPMVEITVVASAEEKQAFMQKLEVMKGEYK